MQTQQENLERAMNYVRRDGLLTAPVCFLTIEDGGPFIYTSAADFMARNFVTAAEVCEVSEGKPAVFGGRDKPAQYMSKIMMTLFTGNIVGWDRYRANLLTLRNESNIKFYPIPRPSQKEKDWPSEATQAIGLSLNEYLAKCQIDRPAIIYEKNREAFDGNRLYIVLGAKNEWCRFLTTYVYQGAFPDDTRADANRKYRLYYNADKSFAFACFNSFRPGIFDDDVVEFANIIRPLVDERVRGRINMEL